MRRLISRSVAAAGSARPSAPSSARRLTANMIAPRTTTRSIYASVVRRNPADYNDVRLPSTATSYPTEHITKATDVADTPYFLNNRFVASETTEFIDLHDPATNELVTRVPQMTDAELKSAAAAAQAAFPAWSATSVIHRQSLMFKFVGLIRDNWERLAASITLEQGKTLADARGDVLRGLQVAEAACGASELLKGEVLEVAKDMETRSYREALGVVGAICPFSMFPFCGQAKTSVFLFFLIIPY